MKHTTAGPVPADLSATVDSIRGFNRFYTRQIGVLQDGYLDSPLSLGQVRVLYEVDRPEPPAASKLAADLGLDPAYLSRVLKGLARTGLVRRVASRRDARQRLVALTPKGRRLLSTLQDRSRRGIEALVQPLAPVERARLTGALRTVQRALGGAASNEPAYILRPHQPGDMGWVVSKHGSLYASEYGWDIGFEALVAGIAQHFIEHFDPRYERCWMAERDGEPVGSVFLVRKSKTVAKLRMLIVDPSARGLGIGKHLVDECARFARQAGYRKITLWTNSILDAARHLYEAAGYRLVERGAPERRFGQDLVFETWELTL